MLSVICSNALPNRATSNERTVSGEAMTNPPYGQQTLCTHIPRLRTHPVFSSHICRLPTHRSVTHMIIHYLHMICLRPIHVQKCLTRCGTHCPQHQHCLFLVTVYSTCAALNTRISMFCSVSACPSMTI